MMKGAVYMVLPRSIRAVQSLALVACISIAAASEAPPVLYVIGDSTAAAYPESRHPLTGWAQVLQEEFDASKLVVDDRARSGRSTKSYIDEGAWGQVEALLKPGDYVFIQFGHNDAKDYDPARYTDPESTFRDNLRTFVSETRAKGATPVLLTPIQRNRPSEESVATQMKYVAAMHAVADGSGVPLIDMNRLTKALFDRLGDRTTTALFMNLEPGVWPNHPEGLSDNTHLRRDGARAISRLAAQAIAQTGLPLKDALLPRATAVGTGASGHYVAYRGGPLLVVGDSGTQCVLQNANLDFVSWVNDCADAGLNTVHVWSFVAPRQQLDGSDVESRYGYVYPGLTPWARHTSGPRAHDGGFQWDLQAWDEGDDNAHYWPRLRALCDHAQARGLLLGITVFWGWPKHPADWAYHPFNVINGGPVSDTPSPHVTQVQTIHSPGREVWQEEWSDAWSVAKQTQWHWERFAEKLIHETAPYDNVFFVFMDEHSYSEGNGGDHFRAFFQSRGCRWVDWEARRENVDFVFDPISFQQNTGKNTGSVERFFRNPARPFMILEGGPYQGDAVRVALWSALMGGAGYVFHNDAEQETVHTGIMGYDPNVPGGDTGAIRRAWHGHAGRFFGGLRGLDAMAPHNELTGADCFCLADPGREYALYAMPESGDAITLDVSAAAGDVACRFFDPRTGAWGDMQTQPGGGTLSIAKPTEEDWVLLVQVR